MFVVSRVFTVFLFVCLFRQGTQLMLWQQHHHDRVSHLQLSPGGTALGTCSWDGTMRVSRPEGGDGGDDGKHIESGTAWV